MSPRMVALALCALAGMAPCCVNTADAQADDALTLARVVFHEAGLRGTADVPGVYAVLRRGADRRGVSLATMARLYSPRAHRGVTARPYAMALTADCSRPGGYPLPWTQARREQCEALIEACRAAVAGTPACEADQWASRDDFRRAQAAGRRFRMIDCGAGAANLFAVEVTR